MFAFNWDAFGAVVQLFGVLAAFLVVRYAIWHEDWKRPKLDVSFDNARDIKDQTNTFGIDPPDQISRWLRVRVVNDPRRRAAKNCRAYLIGVERVHPGGENVDVFPGDVRQLEWMHDHRGIQEGRDLLPGVAHWVDVIAVTDHPAGLQFRTHPDHFEDGNGDYLVTVQVSAEEADPVTINLLVHWGGTRHSLGGRTAGATA